MKRKPNIFLRAEIISLLDKSINEFKNIEIDILNIKEQRLLKGLLLYSYSLFESTLLRLYEIFLKGFPEKMTLGDMKLDKYKSQLFSSSLSHTVISSIVDDYAKNLSYGKSVTKSLKGLCKIFNVDFNRISVDTHIEDIKSLRIELAHRNTLNNQIDPLQLISYQKILLTTLGDIKRELDVRYKSFTKTKLIRDTWNYLFNSPLLCFESHWVLDENGVIHYYNAKALSKYGCSLSSSEKTFLILFMQNYSESLYSSVFSIEDISAHVSIGDRDKIAFIIELFDRYPLLLQGNWD
jgi:hypothetical protein